MVSEYSPHTCTDWNVSCNNIELSKGGVHTHTHTHTHTYILNIPAPIKHAFKQICAKYIDIDITSCYNIHDICIII